MRGFLIHKTYCLFICTPDRIRTCDLRIRSALLYPAELPGHKTLLNCRDIKLISIERRTQKYIFFCRQSLDEKILAFYTA
jgi:hypothetical protein